MIQLDWARNVRCRRSRRSSIVAIGCLITLAASPGGAQDTTATRRRLDSLSARLERTEEELQLLKQQVAAQSQAGVSTRSKLSLELNGRVLVSAFSNSRRTNNVDVPLFVRPDTASGLPQGGAGMAIRQSTIGFLVTGDDVWGGKFQGDLDVDFFGGQQPSSGGRTFPLIRLRTARAMLHWTYGELLIGQEAPLVSPLNPVSLASIGTPGFTGAGNLWLWLPQIRAGIESGGKLSLGLQGAILAPTSGDAASAFDTDFDVAERSKRPFVQGRVHLRWGAAEMAGDVGAGVHRGWFAAKGDSLLPSEAMTLDAKIPITPWLELRGEGFDGKALRGLGGGGVGQGFGAGGVPVRTKGAWWQVNLKPHARVTLGGGSGFDDPDDRDLAVGARLKNMTSELHVHLRPAGPLVFGLEYRRIETTYATGKLANDHLNVAFGFEF